MKKIYFLIVSLLMTASFLHAQNLAINTDGSKADPNAIVDIKSTTKGLLIPRMSTPSRLLIPQTNGLMVYDTDTKSFWYSNGQSWQSMSMPTMSMGWMTTGNSAIDDNINFFGTTDNARLKIRVNNKPAGMIDHIKGNTFWGYGAGNNNTDGNNNTAIGAGAFYTNTTGYNNTAIGSDALQNNTTGYHNVAIGRFALFNNNVGFENLAIGTNALFHNTSAPYNLAIGNGALFNNTRGEDNIAFGYKALYSNTTGLWNLGIGYASLYENTIGNYNLAIGSQSLTANTTGNENTAIGAHSLHSNTTGYSNTAHGFKAMDFNTTGDFNTATGSQSLFANSSGFANTASGYQAMYNNTSGPRNTAIGYQALYSSTVAGHLVALGFQSLYENTSGYDNTALGFRTLGFNTTGYSNTAGGFLALTSNIDGYLNTAFGEDALVSNTSGWGSTALGADALTGNSTGRWNVSLGGGTQYITSSGSFNTAVGTTALFVNHGSENTAVGTAAFNDDKGGSQNTALGAYTAVSMENLNNSTVIGYGAIVNASNKVRIGNAAVTVIEGQVPFTTPSDGRYKLQVREDVKGLEFILQLRAVTYKFDSKTFEEHLNSVQSLNRNVSDSGLTKWQNPERPDLTSMLSAAYDEASSIRRTGFIAQEVEKAAQASGYNFSGIVKPNSPSGHYGLSYELFVVPLVKAVQEQQQIISSQTKKLLEQGNQLKMQQEKIEALLKRMELLENRMK
jgi:hypothetical protein